jgi:ubiquitin
MEVATPLETAIKSTDLKCKKCGSTVNELKITQSSTSPNFGRAYRTCAGCSQWLCWEEDVAKYRLSDTEDGNNNKKRRQEGENGADSRLEAPSLYQLILSRMESMEKKLDAFILAAAANK